MSGARQAIFSGAGSARDITFRLRYNAAPVAEDTASFGRGGCGRGAGTRCSADATGEWAPSRYDCSAWRQAGKRTPMELVFLRHGLAADRAEWKGTDEDRPLTAEGVERTKEVVRGLRALKVRPDAILPRPLLHPVHRHPESRSRDHVVAPPAQVPAPHRNAIREDCGGPNLRTAARAR